MGLCADVPDPPEAPREINPLEILAAQLFFNRQNSESPLGRQEYGSYDADGNWVPFDSAAYGDAYAMFLNDALDGDDNISQASIQALLRATPAESRMIEDPRLRAIREQGQNIDNWRQQIGMGYMNQFGGSPQALPQSQYGLPAGGGGGGGPGGSVGPGANQGFNIPQMPAFPTVQRGLDPSAYNPMAMGQRPQMTPINFNMQPDNNALGGVAGTRSMPFTTSSRTSQPVPLNRGPGG